MQVDSSAVHVCAFLFARVWRARGKTRGLFRGVLRPALPSSFGLRVSRMNELTARKGPAKAQGQARGAAPVRCRVRGAPVQKRRLIG